MSMCIEYMKRLSYTEVGLMLVRSTQYKKGATYT